jgi:hypothetical protein
MVTTLFSPEPAGARVVINAMQGFAIPMPGRTGSLYDYYQGFGLMMGILLIAYGALALLVLRGDRGGSDQRIVLALHVTVASLALAMSARFFFAVPVIATAIALAAWGAALVSVLRSGKGARPFASPGR